MIILLVSEFYPPILGGVEIHVANLAGELADRGHEVHVATLASPPGQVLEGKVHVHRLASAAAAWPWLHRDRSRPFHLPVPDPKVKRELIRLVEDVGPDVVHAHNWMAASLPRLEVPLVMTAHDYAWVCPKRNLLRPDGTVCSGPGALKCLPCSARQYGPAKAVLINAATVLGRRVVQPDAMLAVSGAVARAVAPFASTAPVVVANFVPADLAASTPVRVAGLPAGPFAMFAGAPRAHKGIDVLMEAWQDPPCDLVVAALGAVAATPGPAVHVVHLQPAEMPSAWRKAAVAVVPSVWADPCPTVALEAMTLGVPVVGSAVGGMLDLIDDGVEGLLVAPGDASALRRAVRDLIDAPGRRAAMGAAASRRAAAYSVKVVAATLEEVYCSAIVEHGGTRVTRARATVAG